jgi:TonB-dependent receptor
VNQKLFSSFSIISVLLITLSINVFAQTGKITGKVTDKTTGETLIGLTVGIDGTTKGVVTDIEGRYSLQGLAPGKYNLSFRYLGYQTKNVTGVEVKSGVVSTLNVIMEESASKSLNEVVVTATYKQATVGALYAQQKNNVSISSGISSDIIKRSPDRNTSDVLKRVSGASIQENKFIIVRGLNDRYNSALINNAILSSTEPDKKAFSFDIFPSNLIERIVINKTASPDLPGDFAGGIVQIFTKDVPDENFTEISVGQGYNNISTFKDFKSNINSENKWIGFSADSRVLPAAFPANRQSYATLPDAQKADASRLLANSYPESESTAIPSQNYQVTVGLRKDLKNDATVGSIISLTYRSAQNLYQFVRNDWDNPDTRTIYAKEYYDNQNKFNVTWGGIANFSYKKGNNKISFKNSYNRVLDELYYTRTGENRNNLVDVSFRSNELSEKSFYNTQFEGDHLFGKRKLKFNWNLNYANINRSQPDLRTIEYTRSIGTQLPFEMVDRNSRRFFSDLSDNNIGGSVNLSIPFNFKKEVNTLKIGFLGLQKYRDFSSRIFNYQTQASGTEAARLISLPYNEIFQPENIRADRFILSEFTNNPDSYKGQSTLSAGYLMLDNKLSEKLRLVWGSRLEYFYQNIDGTDLSAQPVDAEEIYLDLLPSFNLTYSLTEKSNLRLSGSKTVTRPEFRELAPFAFFDYQTTASLSGNPDLKRSSNYNADIRFETYPSAGEAITVSAFYKYFQNPIELIANSASNSDLRRFSYQNANSAITLGLEIDFRKTLSFISDKGFFNNTTFFANASYIKSEVSLGNVGGNQNRALQGQSPYLINGGLQYSDSKSGLIVSTLYNRIGQRINVVGFQGYQDWYENGRDVIDIQISKQVFKSKGEFKLNVSDLLSQDFVTYQNMDSQSAFNKDIDRNIFTNNPGRSISLSFSYKFGNRN